MVNKRTAESDQVVAPLFDLYDFEYSLADLDLVEKELAFEAGSTGGRQEGRGPHVGQGGETRGAEVDDHGGDHFTESRGQAQGQCDGQTRLAPRLTYCVGKVGR